METMLDLFDDWFNYPENPAEGIPKNTMFAYISSQYLNGLINYIQINKSIMINRYRDNKIGYSEQLKIFNTECHSRIDKLPDDILIAGQTVNDYWFFWYDKDVSDCMVGRFDKDKCSHNHFIQLFDEYVLSLSCSKGGFDHVQLNHWIS